MSALTRSSESVAMVDIDSSLASEIVSSDRSGGANTSHTIVVPALQQLLDAVPRDAEPRRRTNAQRSSTTSSARTPPARGSERSATSGSSICSVLTRSSSVRFEIYGRTILEASHSLAGLCALARDAVFRASAGAIFETRSRRRAHERETLPTRSRASSPTSTARRRWRRSAGTRSPRGSRRATSSRAPRHEKIRRRPACTAVDDGVRAHARPSRRSRGEALFDTFWARVLDQPRSHLFELAAVASQRSLIDFRRSGGITEVGFTELLRPVEGQLA